MAWETEEHQLVYPISVPNGDGENPIHIEKVTISMPNGRKLREIEGLLRSGEIADEGDIGIDVSLKLIAILSDLPPGGEDELHVKDITALGEVLAPFMEGALKEVGMGPQSEQSPDGGAKTPT
jgi:hypothetical protein